MINFIKQKLNSDLNALIKNKFQFSHTIDELLMFDAQIKCYYKEFYEKRNFYSCLHILCENETIFSNWINLQRQVCQKKLDQLFANLNHTRLY